MKQFKMKQKQRIILSIFLAIAQIVLGILQLMFYEGLHEIFIGIFFIVFGLCNFISLPKLHKTL